MLGNLRVILLNFFGHTVAYAVSTRKWFATLAMSLDASHRNDHTRPITQAPFRPSVFHNYDKWMVDMPNIIDQNYRPAELLAPTRAKRSTASSTSKIFTTVPRCSLSMTQTPCTPHLSKPVANSLSVAANLDFQSNFLNSGTYYMDSLILSNGCYLWF